MEPVEPFNEHFRALGYSSVYFINNMGLQLFAFISFAIFIILHEILLLCTGWWRIADLYMYGRGRLYYNSLISLLTESYANISICCLIALYKFGFSSFGMSAETITSLFFFVFEVISFPLWIVYNFCKGWRDPTELEEAAQ